MQSATPPQTPRLIAAAQPAAAVLTALPPFVTQLLAPNPGPMTLEGTNTWVLRAVPPAGSDPSVDRVPALIVDPGPADAAHLGRLADFGPVAAILVTHGHPDHIEGVEDLVKLLRVRGGGQVQVLWPGEPIPAALVAKTGLVIRTIATPGHTSDSRCLLAGVSVCSVILTGDTILGRGTTMVAHPDGDLGEYLASLRSLVGFTGVAVLPGHGPALVDCGQAAAFYLEHRLARLAQVESAVRAGARTADDVVAAVYADVDRSLWAAAHLSVQAQLSYLESQRPDGIPDLP